MESTIMHDNPLGMPFNCFQYHSSDNPFPITEHQHYFAEIIRVCQGTCRILRNDETFIVPAGSALLIHPLMRHSIDSENGEPVVYDTIKLDLEQLGELPSYTPDIRSMLLEAEQNHVPMMISAEDLHRYHMDFMIEQCVQEFNTRAYGYDLTIRAMLYLLVTNLVRLWMEKGFTPQGQSLQLDPIYRVTSYIEHHISEPLKVEDLARYCGMSYPWFARKFRQIYGVSCKEYIEQVRIQRVEHYLIYTDCDLNHISRNTGYADCSHLVRDFRKLNKTTPGQYRHSQRKIAQAIENSSISGT